MSDYSDSENDFNASDSESDEENEYVPSTVLKKPIAPQSMIKKTVEDETPDDDAVHSDTEDEELDDDIEDEEDNPLDSDDDDELIDEMAVEPTKSSKKQVKPKKTNIVSNYIPDSENENDDEEDEDDEDNYLNKFDNDLMKNYINDFHPECLSHNYEEISKLSVVVRNSDGIIIDPFHKTIPFLTKYEKTRILGQRAKQIEIGAKPLVKVEETIIDSHIIAELELKEKKIPFIIRRPIPGGACEYWNVADLEEIGF
jgi:DNA-directed RNA polymerase I, II, and III subunit RPABC2